MSVVEENLSSINQAINKHAGDRKVSLIAVAKRQSADRIRSALEAGHRVFGENRLQEAMDKWPAFKETYADIELHMIGALQTNKAADAMQLFDVIHTLDREKLAKKIASERDKGTKCPDLLIQVNTGEEEQKSGVLLKDLEGLIDLCRSLDLPVRGLMCIPPVDEEASLHFALLHKLSIRYELPLLSMGMSADYEKAIDFGATHIRVGTGVFGSRLD